jgi:tRNA(fMet)-specific endonuclease VapC
VRFLLDTNVCIDFLNGRFPLVAERIREHDPDDLVLSSIVVAELRYGAQKSQRQKENHQKLDLLFNEVGIIEFDEGAAQVFGIIRTVLEVRGTPIGPFDMLIAAHARSRDLTLVSDNTKEFSRVDDIKLENWRVAPE